MNLNDTLMMFMVAQLLEMRLVVFRNSQRLKEVENKTSKLPFIMTAPLVLACASVLTLSSCNVYSARHAAGIAPVADATPLDSLLLFSADSGLAWLGLVLFFLLLLIRACRDVPIKKYENDDITRVSSGFVGTIFSFIKKVIGVKRL